jgi:hypothetical protein
VLTIGLHGFIEHRKIMFLLASDNDARMHNLSSISFHDANGNEVQTAQTEEFNRRLKKVIEGSKMRFSLAKYESMAGPWVLLGALLIAYSLFMLYKLKATEPKKAPDPTAPGGRG